MQHQPNQQKIIGLTKKVVVQINRIKRRYERKLGIDLSYSKVIEKILKDNKLWKEKE